MKEERGARLQAPLSRGSLRAPVSAPGTTTVPTSLLLVPPLRVPIYDRRCRGARCTMKEERGARLQAPLSRGSLRAPVSAPGTTTVPTSLLLVPPLRVPICGVGSMDVWARDIS
jgi:hypothetical protein